VPRPGTRDPAPGTLRFGKFIFHPDLCLIIEKSVEMQRIFEAKIFGFRRNRFLTVKKSIGIIRCPLSQMGRSRP